jgi:hypothetical protein
MHHFKPLWESRRVTSLSVATPAKAALCRNALHGCSINRIAMTLLTFLKLERLLDDVPTIGKVFRGFKLQRRSIGLG